MFFILGKCPLYKQNSDKIFSVIPAPNLLILVPSLTTMNTLIVSWIFDTFDASLLPYVPYKDNVKAPWDMLKKCSFFW